MVAFTMELPRGDGPRGAGISALVHAALIAGAVLATIQTRATSPSPHTVVPLVYVDPTARAPEPVLRALGGLSAPSAPLLVVPVAVPTVIPPPATAPFDPSRLGLTSPVPAVAAGLAPDSGARGGVWTDRLVEEAPELLSHPPVRFPDVLRQAGVGGRVVVEAVVDTVGRVEPGSIAVRESTNPLFDAPARAVVAGSLYRPGRVSRRPVRVRIRIPVVFQVEGRGALM